jgi:dolichol kinase
MHFSYKKEVLNNILGFSALFLTFFVIVIVVMLMFQDTTLYSSTIPIFSLSFGLPLLIIGAIILISSVLLFLFKKIYKSKDLSKFWNSIEEKSNKRSKLRGDTYRKIPHVLIFIGLLFIWYLGVIIVKDILGSISGMIPAQNNMFLLFLTIITEPDSISAVLFSLGWFYYLLFFFFYGFCFIMIANEFTRKAKRLGFPFNFLCKVLLCEEEKRSYGTYLFFAIGQMVAALITPPMVFLTILGMSSLADLATSQVGIRYGKNKIKWNNEKSWQGSIAGLIVCFIICTLFIGIYWALIFTFAFFLFDVFTNKPLNISDNLLIPFGSGLIFLFVRFFFNFDYYTIILTWI